MGARGRDMACARDWGRVAGAYLELAWAAARGLPDIGLLSMKEVKAEAEYIAKAVHIPALADADTGYGPPLEVMRTAQAFESAGVAGIQLEDQEMPKRCGHLPGKKLVAASEMAEKIAAAVEARSDPDFLIVARTDARSVEGLEAAVRRAQEYADAGADAIFPEALESSEEFRTFARLLSGEGVKVPFPGRSDVDSFRLLPYRGGLLWPRNVLWSRSASSRRPAKSATLPNGRSPRAATMASTAWEPTPRSAESA